MIAPPHHHHQHHLSAFQSPSKRLFFSSRTMSSNKRRRSSDSSDCSTSPIPSSKFAALQHCPTSMFISLPAPPRRISAPSTETPMKRRSPLTPPCVTPPAVTVSDPSATQRARDRCRSPSAKATDLLAKVAVVSATPRTAPSSPRLCAASSPGSSGLSSYDSTPTSSPPDDGGQFPFSIKQFAEFPESGYVSFPTFEAFGEYRTEEEHCSPNRR